MVLFLIRISALVLALAVAGLAQGPMVRPGKGLKAAGPKMGKMGKNMGTSAPGKVHSEPRPNIIDRWENMSPEQRERALAKLPPERRKRIEANLERFHNLTPEQRSQLSESYAMFNSLPPARQEQARRVFGRFKSLPDGRRPLVRREFETLRQMDETEQRSHMNTEEFRNRFSQQEQQLLREMTGVVK
ncbi:MAG: DUF3106 domain-containing protein [Bryobacteraceae bacterium]